MRVIIKKSIKNLGVLLFMMLILTSCNEDPLEIVEQSPLALEGLDGLELITYGNGVNGKKSALGNTAIAVFSNLYAYQNYVEVLETQVEAWDDAFLAQWGHLDDDALNDKEEALNFDSEKPLTDFENQLGLTSLRQKYLEKEELWLNNEVLDDANDPDNDPVFNFDDSEMALLNNLGGLEIGSTIYKQLNKNEIASINGKTMVSKDHTAFPHLYDGAYISIIDGNFNTLIDFNNGDYSVLQNDNVVVNTGTQASCKNTIRLNRKFYPADKRRIKALIKVTSPRLFNSHGKVKTKIKSYRWKQSRWKKYRTHITTGIKGNVYERCDVSPVFVDDMRSTKRKKKRVFKYINKNWSNHYVKKGELKGIYIQKGIKTEMVLTW